MKQPTLRDNYPLYRPAGISTTFLDEGSQYCLKPTEKQGPGTPEHIKKYRKSYKNAHGMTITHYGKVNDPLPHPEFTYGLQTAGSEHVPHVLTDKGLDGINGYMRNLKEEKYARTKNEPLGHTITRNYQWPSKTQEEEFRFGVGTKGSESSKDVMYTPASLNTDEKAKELYIRSHGMYDAGEQRDRKYQWPFNPNQHVFGKTEKLVHDEGRFCLQPETVEETFPKTQIIKKNVEDFRDYNRDHLGKPKNLAQVNPYVGTDFAFGYKPKDKEPWNVAKCITGEAVFKQNKEEESLGRATRHGYRNTTLTGDEGRVFGVPTIRSDIEKPKMRSVADPNNYGDEPAAVGLLFPQRFADLGVENSDFLKLRPKEDIRKMFANIGYAYKPGKFEGIFMRAQEICGTKQDQVSAQAFIEAIKELGDQE